MKPTDRNDRYNAIRARLEAGDARGALVDIEQLIARTPDESRLYALAARARLLLDDPLRALRSAGRAIELDTDDAEAHSLAGAAQLALGRLREAIDTLRRAVQLDPARLTTRLHLAQALVDDGRARDAIEVVAPLRFSDSPTERETTELLAVLDRIERSEPDPRITVIRNDLAAHSPRAAHVSVSHAKAVGATRTTLAALGRDLTALARDHALDPVYGRDREIDALVDVLLRRQKPNPMLTGPAGVGKTALVEAFAQRVASGNVPDRLRNVRIVEISVAALVGGTAYRGELEARLRALLDEADRDPNLVLAIDEIHTLVGAGGMGGELDASEILKPSLARGRFRVIGATTDDDYERVIARDPTLSRRFTRIDVPEPDAIAATTIARAVAHDLAAFHGVRFDDSAPHDAVALAIRHIPARRLPDKAIDLLDQSAVLATRAGRREVTRDDLHLATARLASVPVDSIRDPLAAYADLETRLGVSVLGQHEACARIARRALVHVTRGETNRPLAFAFVGPSGVGKTHAAHAFAEAIHVPCITVDLSDFGESHDLARLAGAPAGYLGHDEASPVVRALRASPGAVLLFEDVDRAHTRVLASIARWIEAGAMTDARGERIDLRHATVVFTITEDSARSPAGFARDGTTESTQRTLPAPLRATVDEAVTFRALAHESLVAIARHALDEVVAAWRAKGRELQLGADVVERIVRSSESRGSARELIATVERDVFAPIAAVLVNGARAVRVEWDPHRAAMRVNPLSTSEPRTSRKRNRA